MTYCLLHYRMPVYWMFVHTYSSTYHSTVFQFFFSSDNPCVQSSSFDKPCFIRWQVLVVICSFYFSTLLPSHSRMQLYLLSDKKCILISTATALLFTVAWFLSFDIPDEWYYCWETVKKQALFSDTIRNERYTLK